VNASRLSIHFPGLQLAVSGELANNGLEMSACSKKMLLRRRLDGINCDEAHLQLPQLAEPLWSRVHNHANDLELLQIDQPRQRSQIIDVSIAVENLRVLRPLHVRLQFQHLTERSSCEYEYGLRVPLEAFSEMLQCEQIPSNAKKKYGYLQKCDEEQPVVCFFGYLFFMNSGGSMVYVRIRTKHLRHKVFLTGQRHADHLGVLL
jgi:hypothetical protein